MKPAGNHIFLESTDKPVSFLFVPESAARKARNYGMGKVIARGPQAAIVNEGDEVAYDRDLGIEIELGGRKYIIIRPKWVLGVV